MDKMAHPTRKDTMSKSEQQSQMSRIVAGKFVFSADSQ